MPITSGDFSVDTTNKIIKYIGSGTVFTVNELYTYLLDFIDNESTIQYLVPMSAQTPSEYTLINGWFLDDTSTQKLLGGAIQTSGWNTVIYKLTMGGTPTNPISSDIGKVVTNGGSTHTGVLLYYTTTSPYIWYVRATLGVFSAEAVTITSGTGAGTIASVATGETIWSNIFSLGSLVAGTTLDVYQDDTQITPWWSAEQIDILVRVKEASVETDLGYLTVLARLYGTLYDHYLIDASTGRNPVPLAAFADGNNTTASGTVGAYTGFTFTFGYASKDIGNGAGLRPYDCVVECNFHTILEVYEYLKYVTRTASGTTLNGVNGEFYTAVGDVRFDYDTEAVSNFSQTERINGTGGTYGYLVSLLDNGTTGTLVLRNVHGTFVDNMALTGVTTGTTALVNGAVTTITASKQAPFGTYAGGRFFGARGVWLDHVATADVTKYQLIDSTGTTQSPPSVLISVSGVEIGDRVSVFRTTGANETIDKLMYTSHNTSNTSGSGTFVVTTSIASDTPLPTGVLRVVDRDASGNILSEVSYAYTGWTGSTFTLSGTLSATYDNQDTAYVPFIDRTATATTESVNVTYNSDRYVVTRVRKKGIVPFTLAGQVTAAGLPVSAIRTVDTIVT